MVSEMIHNAMNKYKYLSALKIGERNITYDSLNKLSLKIASLFVAKGVIGKNIGIVGQRNYSAYVGILGSIYSGNAYVPINKKYPEKKIKDIILAANIEVLICSEEDSHQLQNIIKSLQAVEFVLIPELDEFSSYSKIKTAADLNNLNIIKEPVTVRPSDNIYVMFTSGSTGKPKGVQVMHSNVASLIISLDPIYVIEPGYNSSQTFDLSFDPSVCDMFLTWYKGGCLCVLSEEELYCPSEYITREKINFWHSVPTLANNINRLGHLKDGVFQSIKYSIFAGEPFTVDLANNWARAAPNSRVENRYGPTELTVDVTQHIFTPDDNYKNYNNGILPIGTAFTNQRLKIINKDDKIISKNYKNGELVVSGSQVTKGYLNDNKKTNQSFVRFKWDKNNHLWYRTGDLVLLNQDNNIECIGRIDKQIKISGRRIELGEIEAALRGQIKGYDAIVVPCKNKRGIVQSLVAYVTLDLSDEDIRVIRKSCAEKLEDLFFPKKFIYIKDIPTTISGKIDRVLLEKKAIDYTRD